MKKSATVGLLLIVILLSLGFVVLKSQALGSPSNYFNRNLRRDFATSPLFREILGLHYDGDAKTDYLGERYSNILVEVDTLNSQTVRLSTLDGLVKKIQEITSKETEYLVSDRDILSPRQLGADDIEKIAGKYRNHFNTRDTATIYFLVANADEEDDDKLGTTLREYGIVLFSRALTDFADPSSDALGSYELSTALHEFGHQLGLSHNTEPGCLMNESVELKRNERPEDVVVDFCQFEKALIR